MSDTPPYQQVEKGTTDLPGVGVVPTPVSWHDLARSVQAIYGARAGISGTNVDSVLLRVPDAPSE